MRKYLTIAFASVLVSCAPTQQKQKELAAKQINSPELNTTVSREIGQALVEKGYEHQEKAILLKAIPPLKTMTISTIKAGDILSYIRSENSSDLYYNSDTERIAINANTGKAAYFTTSGIIYIPRLKPQIEYEYITITRRTEAGFKQQFIYNGKSGSTIKFTYREFNGDMARPAFTQDLQYDLTESSTIGFKEVRMEILEATNVGIEYKVLQSFGE